MTEYDLEPLPWFALAVRQLQDGIEAVGHALDAWIAGLISGISPIVALVNVMLLISGGLGVLYFLYASIHWAWHY
jgi:hypothetical protein